MTGTCWRFKVLRNALLPPMAWLCRANVARGECELEHGAWVEANQRFFVEGCWAGDFSAGGLDSAEAVFGSGAVAVGSRLVFVPASATTDCLFFREEREILTVSNSLPFLLAAIGDQLDPFYERYDADNFSVTRGIDAYQRCVPTVGGKVQRLLHRNLVVSDGRVYQEDKPWPPQFPDFDAYFAYLKASVGSLIENARSESRLCPLAVLTTQSRGYDTTAINSLAASHGVDVAFTCPSSKGRGRFADADANIQEDDDGAEIAQRLGIPCVRIDRRRFERPFDSEYLYFAALDAPQDLNLVELNEKVKGPSILLTGALGEIWYPERVWGGQPGYATPDLQRWDLGCHGLSEVRLQYGYIQCAIPYIGARRRAEINAITESNEMLPWSVGGAYDRPIPRRIAESAGVPRWLFGQKKLASVVEFVAPRVPVSPGLRREYLEFLRQNHILGSVGQMLLPVAWKVNTWLVFSRHRYYIERLLRLWPPWKSRESFLLLSALNGRPFCFGVNRRIRDYKSIMNVKPREEVTS